MIIIEHEKSKNYMNKKIILGSAGGAPTESVYNSLKISEDKEEIIGIGADKLELAQSDIKKKYLVPLASSQNYIKTINNIIENEEPGFLHFQNDLEIYKLSKNRSSINNFNKLFYFPPHSDIENCSFKYSSYKKFLEAGIKVPKNMLIINYEDLIEAFKILTKEHKEIWLRSNTIGGGGKGSLKTSNIEFAKNWIDHHDGWGEFIAAELLSKDTVTWQSIWYEGELVLSQARKRYYWVHGNRAISGITGVTGVGEIYSDKDLDYLSIETIHSINKKPHGIYGVDFAYDFDGVPNPTEINAARFFTTINFFTECGVNFPEIYKNIFLYNKFPTFEDKFNTISKKSFWFRSMDKKPKLLDELKISEEVDEKYIY